MSVILMETNPDRPVPDLEDFQHYLGDALYGRGLPDGSVRCVGDTNTLAVNWNGREVYVAVMFGTPAEPGNVQTLSREFLNKQPESDGEDPAAFED